jgi:hypothetical protein
MRMRMIIGSDNNEDDDEDDITLRQMALQMVIS